MSTAILVIGDKFGIDRNDPTLKDVYYSNPSMAPLTGILKKFSKAVATHPEAAEALTGISKALVSLHHAACSERDAEKIEKETRAKARKAAANAVTSNGVRLRTVSKETFDTMTALLSEVRKRYTERAVEVANYFVRCVDENLKAHNGNVLKAYPTANKYPGGNRWLSVAQVKMNHKHCVYSGPTFPETATAAICPDAVKRYIAAAVRSAQMEADSYIIKLAIKIGTPVLSGSVSGDLWNGSVLTVETAEGRQVWSTRCIENRSVLGKYFAQWPTRRVGTVVI